MANEFADQSILYIYADGPKEAASDDDSKNIAEVRELIRSKQWCGEVHVIESEVNKGLASSIIGGVTDVVNKYGKVIVLEDDLVTSKGFLRFMNCALEMYEQDSHVYSVTGYMFPINFEESTTALLPFISTWGWGTWAKAWSAFSKDMPYELLIQGDSNLRTRFNLGNYDYSNMMKLPFHKSWGIRWYYSVFEHNGLNLFPSKSLVKNIGIDGSGENCNSTKKYEESLVEFIDMQYQSKIDLEVYQKYMAYFS